MSLSIPSSVSVSSQVVNWPCKATTWSVCPKTGKAFVKITWEPIVAPIERMSAFDLTNLTPDKHESWSEFIEGAMNITDIEKSHPNDHPLPLEDFFTFQCLYCYTNFKFMKDQM